MLSLICFPVTIGDGATGYAYASPTGSNKDPITSDSTNAMLRTFMLDGAVSEADKKKIQYDPDLLSITDSSFGVAVLDVRADDHASNDGDPDFNNLSAFVLAPLARGSDRGRTLSDDFIQDLAAHAGITSGSLDTNSVDQIRRLTTRVSNADSMLDTDGGEAIRYVIVGGSSVVSSTAAAGS